MSLATQIASLATRVATEFKTLRTELSSSMEQSRITVKNSSGATIAKGSAVYVSGANGTNVLISNAQANSEATSSKTLGLLAQDLVNNGIGYVITDGNLAGLDTSLATVGDPVWLSPTVAGGLAYGLANKPSAPNHLVYIGVVTRVNNSNGEIFVHVQNGFELNELHDVAIASPATNDVIKYDGSKWVNGAATVATHTHAITDVTNLQTTLDGKADESSGTVFPSTPSVNQIFTHTTKKCVYIYNGSQWIEFARPNAIEPLLLIGI